MRSSETRQSTHLRKDLERQLTGDLAILDELVERIEQSRPDARRPVHLVELASWLRHRVEIVMRRSSEGVDEPI